MDESFAQAITFVFALFILCFLAYLAYEFVTRFRIADYLIRNVGRWVPYTDIQLSTRATARVLDHALIMYVEKDMLEYQRNQKATDGLSSEQQELLKTAKINRQTVKYFEYRVIVRKPVRKKFDIKDYIKIPGVRTAFTSPLK